MVPHHNNVNQEATYALFSANNDAICNAYTTITWPSGDKYAWLGNWGRSYGGIWYYSNVYVDSTGEQPDCFWIDGNNDQQEGFQFHWPEYVASKDNPLPTGDDATAFETDHICNSPTIFMMHIYPNTDPRSIIYIVLGGGTRQRSAVETSYGPSKEAESARFQPQEREAPMGGEAFAARVRQNLAVSNSTQHTAEGLCESATSFGPDFLNVQDGTFCRMSDKTLWSACNNAVTDNCFDVSTEQLISGGLATRDAPYGNIID